MSKSLFNGPALRAIRESKGMSREHLAVLAEVSYQSVVRWELNNGEPRLGMVAHLAEVLDVDALALLNVDVMALAS